MARELILNLNKNKSTFGISKIDRKKLYGFKKRLFLRVLIIGIPPATAASNNNKTLFSSAIENSSFPCLASIALLPVTTLIFFLNNLRKNYFLICPFPSKMYLYVVS